MKIAIDCRSLSTRLTGIGYYTYHLVTELSKIDHENRYKLIYNNKRSIYDRIGNPDTHHYRPASPNFSITKIRLDERLYYRLNFRFGLPKLNWLTGKIDIFHGPSFFPWSLTRGKYILTVHDLTTFKVPETVSAETRQYYQKCHRMSIPKADFIIADSNATKVDIMELFGVPEDRIKVVYLGTTQLRRGSTPDVGNLTPKLPYILSVGTLEPRKNHSRLIKAFSLLKGRNRIPHKLILAGTAGWRHEEIVAEAEKSSFSKDIAFPGYQSPEQIQSLYEGADLFAYVSLYEGFGLPILEAMGAGIPVVYAENTSMVEVAGDACIGVDAYDIESIANGILRPIEDSKLALEMARRGRERASQFTWEKTAKETLDVYHHVGI